MVIKSRSKHCSPIRPFLGDEGKERLRKPDLWSELKLLIAEKGFITFKLLEIFLSLMRVIYIASLIRLTLIPAWHFLHNSLTDLLFSCQLKQMKHYDSVTIISFVRTGVAVEGAISTPRLPICVGTRGLVKVYL